MAEPAIQGDLPEPETPAPSPAGGGGGPAPTAAGPISGQPTGEPGPKDTPKPAAVGLPDDWREQMAGENADLQKLLNRYTTPQNLASAFHSLRTKLSSGEYRRTLPADADDAERAQWRKDNGIPDKWEDYQVDLGEGVVLPDYDKPVVNSFLEYAHGESMPPDYVNKALRWYTKFSEQEAAAVADTDRSHMEDTIGELKMKWGGDYDRNKNNLRQWLGDLFPIVEKAVDPTGRRLGNNAAVMDFLAQAARELRPFSTSSGDMPFDSLKTVNARMAEILNTPGYTRNKALQDEYRDLIPIREKLRNAG